MPIEMDHPAPPSRELYRFRPWFERPLTQGQVQACLVACWSVVAAVVVACGAAVWVASWLAGLGRWFVTILTVLILAVLIVAGRDARRDFHKPSSER